MKRARGNGGARDKLRPEGILVLGHQDNDPLVAQALGLPVHRKGELISARVVRARADRTDRVAEIAGVGWAIAWPGDPVEEAPVVPRRRSELAAPAMVSNRYLCTSACQLRYACALPPGLYRHSRHITPINDSSGGSGVDDRTGC